MLSNRARSLAGMALVADGAAFLTNPRGQLETWSSPRAPVWYRSALDYLGAHTGVCRALAAAELVAGLTLLRRVNER